MKGSPLGNWVCPVDLCRGRSLKRDDTTEARPFSAASHNFFSTGSDIHKNKEDQMKVRKKKEIFSKISCASKQKKK